MADFSTVVVQATNQVVSVSTATQVVRVNSATPGTYADVESFMSLYHGTGSPEGVVTAPVGSRYRQTDGIGGTVLWAKGFGSGNTGWTRVKVSDGRANAQRFLSLLHRNAEDATLLLVGDSTSTVTYWSPIFFNALATLFPAYTVTLRYWSTVSNAYGSPATLQTGTGSQTLNIYNCGISGANTATHTGPYHYAMIGAVQPHYCLVSLGHNENATASYWEPQMLELISSLTQTLPQTDFCLVGQNPSALDNNQALRARVYERIAAWYGMGWVDIEQFMNDTGGAAVYTSSVDHVHPNATGSTFWAACLLAAFQYCEVGETFPSNLPWLEVGDELLTNGDFSNFPSTASVPTGWVAGGSATITQDTTNYESANGYAVKIQASGGTSAKMQQTFNGTKCAGKWLTMVARIYVASGQPSSAGELGLSDHVSSDTYSRITTAGQGAFRWVVHQHFVDPASTQITAIIYGDQTTTNGACTVDRVSLRIGRLPMTSQTGGAVALNRVVAGTGRDGTYKFGSNTGTSNEIGINGTSTSARNLSWYSAGVARWIAQVTTNNNFSLLPRDASGNAIDTALHILNVAGGAITWATGRLMNVWRLQSSGTAHVASDWAASAGWGTSPTITPLSTDMGGRVSILAQATTSANPTLTLTFKDGTWGATAPHFGYGRGDTNSTAGRWSLSSVSSTVAVWTFVGTPVAGETYFLDFDGKG